jgi:DNA-binding transcriptional LysR family regulator
VHFGRAAIAPQIAQPVLSRQIKALEDELKVQLFVRDKRATELSAAGTHLLADARPLLAPPTRCAAGSAGPRAGTTASPSPSCRVSW